MDVDDNLHPEILDSPNDTIVVGLGSFPIGPETAHGNIEEHIRLPETLTSGAWSTARQLQRWRQNLTPPQSVNISGTVDTNATSNVPGQQITGQDTTLELGTFGRRLNSYLVAKALEMDNDGSTPINNLNPEMLDSFSDSIMVALGSFLNDSETARGNIEERIRLLEAVTSRARQLQIWRQTLTAPQSVNISRTMDTNATSNVPGQQITGQDMTLEMGPFGSRLNSFLIAKALEMDNDGLTSTSEIGSFYDCNICLNIARDPILTPCGHLFCWPCFYQLSYINSDVKECPVCMEQVTDRSIVPVYGHGSGNDSHQCQFNQFGLKVPPRPRAHRIENTRQQHLD